MKKIKSLLYEYGKDPCKCPNCGTSLSDMVDEYDNQDILPKEQKIFICPSCNKQLIFEKLYSSILVATLLILIIFILFESGCYFTESCNSSKSTFNIIGSILGLFFGFLVFINKWVPRLKIYKS